MAFNFRLAGEDDTGQILEFMRAFYAGEGYPFDERAAGAALAELVRTPDRGRAWLIMENEEPVGYVALTFGYSLEFHGRDAFVDELFVRSERRDRGAGTAALRFVMDVCPALGVHALHLEVERVNTAAQALYRRFGFHDHDRYLMTWRMREDGDGQL
ncbi:MAG TPA: GNAT family N-acetyltransferase [Ktedonobacterales bacterium]|nr:GNAT family N-acetyltransferase [Ktedonobacterales bacterium]